MVLSTTSDPVEQTGGRIHLRRRCHLRLDRPGGSTAAVKDIGLGGLRLSAGDLRPGDVEDAKLHIPGSAAACDVRYEVVHVSDSLGAGARFDGLGAGARLRLTEYVDHVRSVELLKRLQAQLGAPGLRNLKPLGDPDATQAFIERLAFDGADLRLWSDPREPVIPARLVEARDGHLTLRLHDGSPAPRPFEEVLFAVADGDLLYLADTTVARGGDGVAVLVAPDRLYRPERRQDLRDAPDLGGVGEVTARVGGALVRLTVLEESGGGLSVLALPGDAGRLRPGARVEGLVERRGGGVTELDACVAYASPVDERGFRVGLQRRVDRIDVPVAHLAFDEKAPSRPGLGAAVAGAARSVARPVRPAPPAPPDVVRLVNRRGETVVALRNATPGVEDAAGACLIVIPPAYGRKKEDTCPLALSIVETFSRARAAAVVVRYDATHAVGESERSARWDADPEYHNAGYTLSQGADDLHDVIEHFRAASPGGAGPVGIVSFSLSATVARRVVADDGGRRIRSWVAPMGAADTRDLVRNSTGGIDYLEENRRGVRRGFRQVVGHIMDVESFCDDAWRSRMADLADARSDMARIGVPVTWICGTYDYWVNLRRVADMLTVRGPEGAGRRELITVPTGHIVRTSDEAVETFKVVAARLARDLLGREVEAAAPPARDVLAASKEERDRLRRPDFDPRTYWRGYLLGSGDNAVGFDVITLTAEYQDLLAAQAAALGAAAGHRIVDLGAGTGNAAEAVIEALPPAGVGGPVGEVNLVDLVPEALQTARAKLDRFLVGPAARRATVWTHAFDLAAVGARHGGALPFGDASVDRVVIALVLSYLPDPVGLLTDVRRILRPGGRVVVSSFLPDTDLSGPLRRLMARLAHAGAAGVVTGGGGRAGAWRRDDLLEAVRAYVNDAARLLDLACDGVFRLYDDASMADLLRRAGFRKVRTQRAFGSPGQAVIASAER